MAGGILSLGPDVVDYLPPPFDVEHYKDDAPANGFLNFPLTVV